MSSNAAKHGRLARGLCREGCPGGWPARNLAPILATAFAAASVAACGGPASQFKITGPKVGGQAAYYDVVVGGRSWGDARVWSEGGYLLESNGLTFESQLRVRNDSDETIEIDAKRAYLEYISRDGEFIRIDDAAKEGTLQVEPRSSKTVKLSFDVPEDVDTGEISGFELNWFVETPEGLYSESTPFERVEREEYYYYYPYSPYYDAFSPYYDRGAYIGMGWAAPL